MTKSKSLLQEAIAEAREVREAAIQNAYESLKESLTPSIKEALASKLQEEDVDLNEDEETLEETSNSGFKEVKVKAPKKQEIKEEEETEEPEEEAEEEPAEEPEGEPDGDEDGGEANGDHEEPDGDEPEETEEEPEAEEAEEISDDTKLDDLTVGQLKDLISDVVAQSDPTPAPEGDLGVDMEAGDVEGQGEEDVPLEGEPDGDEFGGEATGDHPEPDGDEPEEAEDDEIDLAEILKELETEGKAPKKAVKKADEDIDQKMFEMQNKLNAVIKERNEAIRTIKTLKESMADINLVNSKLQCATRLFSQNSLSEGQKVKVLQKLDEAKSPKEAKDIYLTLKENIKPASTSVLKEHRSIASRSAGNSTKGNSIVEVDPVVKRFQQLAGII